MVTLAAEPGGFEQTVIVRGARRLEGLGVTAGPLRADADVAGGGSRPGPRRRASPSRRGWPRRAVRAARPGAGDSLARPVLGAAPARGARAAGASATARSTARASTPRRTGAPRSPTTGGGGRRLDRAGVAFAGGRVHGVAPTAVAAWTPDGLVTLAPPFARTRRPRGRRRVARPRALAALAAWRSRARPPDPLLLPVPHARPSAARGPLAPPPARAAARCASPRAAAVARERRPGRRSRTARRRVAL